MSQVTIEDHTSVTMGSETSKSIPRRLLDSNFAKRYFVGNGIDIGSGGDSLGRQHGHFPLMSIVRNWDTGDGDAQYMQGVDDESFDFVHSSHCLEHLVNPRVAIKHWWRILRPCGHLVVIVPDEDMYEQGVWPSTFNGDHRHTFTTYKMDSWSPVSVNVFDLIESLPRDSLTIKVERLIASFKEDVERYDQTSGVAECAIEFIVKKVSGV